MLGLLLQKVKKMFKKEYRVLMFGKTGAGATTILYKLKYQLQIQSICGNIYPVKTIAFRNMQITYINDAINLMRNQYLKGQVETAQGIIYVFDIADRQTFQEQTSYFRTIINHKFISQHNIPILIFANKTDLCPLSQEQIERMIPLKQIKQPFKLLKCCAIIAEGLDEGMRWISEQLSILT